MVFFISTNDINMPLIILASIGQPVDWLYSTWQIFCLLPHTAANMFAPRCELYVYWSLSKNVFPKPSGGICIKFLHPVGTLPLEFHRVNTSVFQNYETTTEFYLDLYLWPRPWMELSKGVFLTSQCNDFCRFVLVVVFLFICNTKNSEWFKVNYFLFLVRT